MRKNIIQKIDNRLFSKMGLSLSKKGSIKLPKESRFAKVSGKIKNGKGYGTLVHKDGRVYRGKIKNFLPNGKGTWKDKKKRLIAVGLYKDGIANGSQDLYTNGILTFHAVFKNGVANGEGTEYCGEMKPIRSGVYVNGLREGTFIEYRNGNEVKVVYPLSFSNKENNLNKDRLECSVCMDKEISRLVLPCNHLCLCKDCSESTQNQLTTCPVCREPIQSFRQIYF